MTREDFLNLTEDEQTAFLSAEESQASMISDLEAERNSLSEENKSLRIAEQQKEAELKKTKELNFTLARQVSTGSASTPQSAEDIIHNMFKRG